MVRQPWTGRYVLDLIDSVKGVIPALRDMGPAEYASISATIEAEINPRLLPYVTRGYASIPMTANIAIAR